MKRIIFVLLVGVFIYSCGSDNKVKNVELQSGENVVDTFANGSPHIVRKYKMVKGVNEGVYEKEYYEDGKILKEGPLKGSNRDGIWKAYYRNGKLWNTGTFVMGVRSDTITGYFENGNIKYQGIYEDGIKHGVWSFYDEDGNFVESKVYVLPGEKFEDSIKISE